MTKSLLPIINKDRLKNDLEEISKIGRQPGHKGLFRMAFTDEEEKARKWLIEKLEAAGLSVKVDGARNICARYGDWIEAAVATGSHLDTVPDGGHLDGTLGVIAGLECLRRIKEEDIALKRPVELIVFSDEEGRFGSMLGSKAICGQHKIEDLKEAKNPEGKMLEDALQLRGTSINEVINAKRQASEFDSFVELHIEQGPVLDQKKKQIGIVTDIVGLFRWQAAIFGEANHAGTTPMDMRRDAFSGLVEFSSTVDQVLKDHGNEHSRATIGKVETFPGAPGVVPSEVRFTLDVRDPSSNQLGMFLKVFQENLKEICQRRNLDYEVDTIGELEPISCTSRVLEIIQTVTEDLGFSYIKLPSGAVHDTLTMSTLTKTGMIFIPSIKGVSHSPEEYSDFGDIENGTNVLLRTLVELAQK